MKSTRMKCFGSIRDGGDFVERDCINCPVRCDCETETALRAETKPKMKKQKLDPVWVFQAVDMMIGPQLAMLAAREPGKAPELAGIIADAVKDLHEKNEYENTNAWVVAACNKTWELYNTYMTAMLMDRYDKGIPQPPKIIVPGSKLNM